MMLYHYTDRASARDILKDGVIAAHPVSVRTELNPSKGKVIELAPAVWFTTSEEPSNTVLAKMLVGGWPLHESGVLWRFGVDDTVVHAEPLPVWAEGFGYKPHMFRFMITTGMLIGDNAQDWRLISRNVYRSEWACVQYLKNGEWIDYCPPTGGPESDGER